MRVQRSGVSLAISCSPNAITTENLIKKLWYYIKAARNTLVKFDRVTDEVGKHVCIPEIIGLRSGIKGAPSDRHPSKQSARGYKKQHFFNKQQSRSEKIKTSKSTNGAFRAFHLIFHQSKFLLNLYFGFCRVDLELRSNRSWISCWIKVN